RLHGLDGARGARRPGDDPHRDDPRFGTGVVLRRGLQPRPLPPPRPHPDPRALRRLLRPGPLRKDQALETMALVLTAATAAGLHVLGARRGRALPRGELAPLVAPLGAVKPTVVRGTARGPGLPADRHVASPTFALVNEHPGRVALVHADLYRIE